METFNNLSLDLISWLWKLPPHSDVEYKVINVTIRE